jgi:hypothetical protein
VTLSSFHPMQPQMITGTKVKTPTPRTLSREVSAQIGRRVYTHDGRDDQAPMIAETPPLPADPPTPPTPSYDGVPIDPREWVPPELIERVPQISDDVRRSVERAMRENEGLRELMARVRYQVREEARRQRWRRMSMKRHQVRPQELESIGMVFTPY